MEQRSTEWYEARLGKVTASRVGAVMDYTKAGKPSARRTDYMMELLCERLTNSPSEYYQSKEMLRGVEKEPEAISAFEAGKGFFVDKVGFVAHPSIKGFGASPDGETLTRDGLMGLEVKCPKTSTHINFLTGTTIKQDYIWQMNAQMACCDYEGAYFQSFDDRLPDRLQSKIVFIERDEKVIQEMELEVIKFLSELDALCAKVSALKD